VVGFAELRYLCPDAVSAPLAKLSKFLSFVLRHQPDAIGIKLDANGWVRIDELVEKCRARGEPLTRDVLEEIVTTSEKQRFSISEDGLRIRANQGHSVEVDLALEPKEPPEFLFHGTVARSIPSIRSKGLTRMQRHHVHLSSDQATARAVGMRRGKPVVLRIEAARMHREGCQFFLSDNGVWLTDSVPPEYIAFPPES
jgi:putative RNA 2'-phosphotransferase